MLMESQKRSIIYWNLRLEGAIRVSCHIMYLYARPQSCQPTGKCILSGNKDVKHLAISPNGDRVAGLWDSGIYIHVVNPSAEYERPHWTRAIALTNTTLVSALSTGSIQIADALPPDTPHNGPNVQSVSCLSLSPHELVVGVATSAAKIPIQVYSLADPHNSLRLTPPFSKRGAQTRQVAILDDKIAWRDRDRGLPVWQRYDSAIAELQVLGKQFEHVCFSFSDTSDHIVSACITENRFLAQSPKSWIKVWDVIDGREVETSEALREVPIAIAFPSDELVIAVTAKAAIILR